MNVYEEIANHNFAAVGAWSLPKSLEGKRLADYPASAGCKIMLNMRGTVIADLMEKFIAFGEGDQWKWLGQAGSNKFGLLDRTKLSGECYHFVQNFTTLVRAPAPFGLGLVLGAGEGSSFYKGTEKNGFVSHHTRNYFDLSANVLQPGPQCAVLRVTYLWDNHKVFCHAGRFYDVCYNAQYTSKDDMALYMLQDEGFRLDGKQMTITNSGDGKNFYAATNKTTGKFLFRKVIPAECIDGQLTYEGPLVDTRGMFGALEYSQGVGTW